MKSIHQTFDQVANKHQSHSLNISLRFTQVLPPPPLASWDVNKALCRLQSLALFASKEQDGGFSMTVNVLLHSLCITAGHLKGIRRQTQRPVVAPEEGLFISSCFNLSPLESMMNSTVYTNNFTHNLRNFAPTSQMSCALTQLTTPYIEIRDKQELQL